MSGCVNACDCCYQIDELKTQLAEAREAVQCAKKLIEVVRSPNIEWVADDHNAAVKKLRALTSKE